MQSSCIISLNQIWSYIYITNIHLTRPSLAVNTLLLPRWLHVCISGPHSTSGTSHLRYQPCHAAVLIDDASLKNFTLKSILTDWYFTLKPTGHIKTHRQCLHRQHTALLSKIRKYYLAFFSIRLPPWYSSDKHDVITFSVRYYTWDILTIN